MTDSKVMITFIFLMVHFSYNNNIGYRSILLYFVQNIYKLTS